MTHQLFPGKLEHRDTVKRIKQKQIKVLKFSGSLRQLCKNIVLPSPWWQDVCEHTSTGQVMSNGCKNLAGGFMCFPCGAWEKIKKKTIYGYLIASCIFRKHFPFGQQATWIRAWVWKTRPISLRKGDSGNPGVLRGIYNTFQDYKRLHGAKKQECWQAAQPLSGLNLWHKKTNLNIAASTMQTNTGKGVL